LLRNVKKLGENLTDRIKEMHEKYEIIGDARGIGLMAGVELVTDRKTKKPAKEKRNQILDECLKNGLIIIGAGPYKNVIRFLPPLNINEDLLSKGLNIFENAIKAVSER
jgi:4-aminobutyrate aminotransferase/(S)-3-amino-2-methylpropionate transaminase